jgi:L-ascorbate metabolism protein UlaG (beta-lactamase superfamily)
MSTATGPSRTGRRMKVTKFAQSCLVLEKDGGRIAIDPGSITMDHHSLDELGHLDAVLYTHRHHDHFDERCVDALHDRGVRLYGNADVCSLVEGMTELRDDEVQEVAGFRVHPRDLPHVPMVDGAPGPPNTGFLVDGELFHPGDGMDLADLRARLLALPIAGPSISFRDAHVFAERVGASVVVPMHYDFFVADPALFARYCDVAEVVVLGAGETAEL